MRASRVAGVLAVLSLIVAGCTGANEPSDTESQTSTYIPPYTPVVSVEDVAAREQAAAEEKPEGTTMTVVTTDANGNITTIEEPVGSTVMTFRKSIITAANAVAQDLYEPTLEVSDTGVIYAAAHVIGAATTGTPAWFSKDDGATWAQLPLAGPVALPGQVQGAQPPPGDEGFIVAGDNGQAWMADIYLAGFSVSGWCNDGGDLCYDNRQAYDRTASAMQDCEAGATNQLGNTDSLNDRPWAAYGDGALLLVNNPGGGAMQIASLAVPPMLPAGSIDPVTGPKWNMCASPGGHIPGVPAMDSKGNFAVPQMSIDLDELYVVTGNIDDVFDVQHTKVFDVTTSSGGTTNGGRTAFGLDGTLFVGAYNNSDADGEQGQFILASSTNGVDFVNVTFQTSSPMRSLYLDNNMAGPGALLTWSQLGETQGRSDWYVAHVQLGPHGEPMLKNINLAVDEGPMFSAHVMGAGAGPDGRAYFVVYEGATLPDYVGSTPLSVWIQESGPTLPKTVLA